MTQKKIDFGFQSLEDITKPTVTTAHAAYLLNREPRTLRGWSCYQNGPIQPSKVFGKLTWDVPKIKTLMGVE